jgi:hypothetical protein
MKFRCRWCHEDIEISQTERAKNGLKKLEDHEVECFKQRNPNFGKIFAATHSPPPHTPVPDKFDMQGIIKYLHHNLGRLPTENECLRFHMFLGTYQQKPTDGECKEFINLLKEVS